MSIGCSFQRSSLVKVLQRCHSQEVSIWLVPAELLRAQSGVHTLRFGSRALYSVHCWINALFPSYGKSL